MSTLPQQPHSPQSHSAAIPIRAQDDTLSISNRGCPTRFKSKRTIFSGGDDAEHFYLVVTGAVRLSKYFSDGRRQIAEFALRGDLFGVNWTKTYALTAEALTDVTLVRYGQEYLEHECDENRSVRVIFLSALKHRVWAAQNHLVTLGRQCASERVASFLVYLMERSKQMDKRIIDVPMTREDIGEYLGRGGAGF